MAAKHAGKKPKQVDPPRQSPRPIVLGVGFILCATLIVYLPAIRAGFVWDDPEYILHNPTLRTMDGLQDMWLVPTSLPQWYPMVHTTFWIEYHLVGTQPMLYHIDNVLLHAINSILIWMVLRKLKVPGAFFAACLFALHPVMVESVAWVTERKNVLSLLFYLLALRIYLFKSGFGFQIPAVEEELTSSAETRNPTPEPRLRGLYFASFALFAAALFSKSVTASLPAAILLILWWKKGRLTLRDVYPLIPFFIAGILMGLTTGSLEHNHVGASAENVAEFKDLTTLKRCLIAGRAVWFYLGKLVIPHSLAFIYPRWNEIDTPTLWQWIYPVLVVGVTATLILLRHRIGRGVLTAWLLFCGTLFPALGFVNVYPMRFSYVADHFQYHASIAMFALFAALTTRLPARPRGALWGTLLGVAGLMTWQQARVYTSAQTLWEDTLKMNPNSWMVNTNLAHVLRDQGTTAGLERAAQLYRRALQLAPYLHDTHTNVGIIEGMFGHTDAAMEQFREGLKINNRFAPAYYGLGEAYDAKGADKLAEENFRLALQYAPDFAEAHFRLALILERKAEGARERYQKNPNPEDLKAQGQFLEAIDHLRSAVAANNDFLKARVELGLCLTRIQKFDEAIWNFSEAVRIDPNNAEAWTDLGGAQLANGRRNDAFESFSRALQINPNLIPAQRGLKAATSFK